MKKQVIRTLTLVLVLMLTLPVLTREARAAADKWDGSIAEKFAGGSGTSKKPYLIKTAAQLAFLAQSVNDGTDYSGTYFSLEEDLDLDECPWTPIGNYSSVRPFRGVFYGNAHTIAGLYVKAPTRNGQGLFGYTMDATIRNLRLADVFVSGNQNVGALVGYDYEYGSGSDFASCTVSGEVQGETNVGGLVGFVSDGSQTISYCTNHADVTANDSDAGGIVGNNSGAYINNCLNTGSIRCGGNEAGGICGDSSVTIKCCMNTGEIIGAGDVGGITGRTSYRTINCANLGTVRADSGGNAGGLLGYTSLSVSNCYNGGTVEAENGGAICGERKYSSNLEFCYALEGTAEELVYEGDSTGASFVSAVNTASFLNTLNRNLNTTQNGTWLRDPDLYDGCPYFDPRTVWSISVTPASKVYYQKGEKLDLTDMVVTAHYNDGSFAPLTSAAYTTRPRNGAVLERKDNKVTVYYNTSDGNLTDSFEITVLHKLRDYQINALTVCDMKGKQLSTIPGSRFLAYVSLTKIRGDQDNVTILLAAYDSNGAMVSEPFFATVQEPADATVTHAFSIDNSSGRIASVKAFVVDSSTTFVPVSEAVSFPAQ